MPGRRVAVVTDSTAYLPEQLVLRYAITVVPLQVVIDGRVGAEGRDVSPAAVAAALAERRRSVSTSRPSPHAFATAYRAADAAAVVSVHLSGELSGTCDSARSAAADCPERDVRVVDSRSTAMGLGFAVRAAAAAASRGADVDEVVAVATATAAAGTTLFYLDTLEHLRRGGRIGAAQAWLGSALAMKPILTVRDGRIAPLEKVRTGARARLRVAELAVAAAGTGPVDLAVHHLAAAARAAELSEELRGRIPALRELYVSEIGAAVGAHVGPGVLGVVVSPSTDPGLESSRPG